MVLDETTEEGRLFHIGIVLGKKEFSEHHYKGLISPSHSQNQNQPLVKDCQFGVSPVNYSDSDSDSEARYLVYCDSCDALVLLKFGAGVRYLSLSRDTVPK